MSARFPAWSGDCATSATLLEQLRLHSNNSDWEEFYDRYARLIYIVAVKRECDQTMACEVVQESMVMMMEKLANFHYDPAQGKFRSYLMRIVHGRICDAFKRQKRFDNLKSFALDNRHLLFEELANAKPPAALDDGLTWDRAWEENLLRLALDQVRQRVQQRTWRSFELNVLQNQPIHEVAKQLGLGENQIYQHKARLLDLVREAYRQLSRELGE